MARQYFNRRNNAFELDLHGCSIEEGRGVSVARIHECFRYGIEELQIIYGSADRVEGTLRQAVEQAMGEAFPFVANASYRDSYGMFASREGSTEVRITIAPNPHPQAIDERMVFSGFGSHYDKEIPYHEPYYPLRTGNRDRVKNAKSKNGPQK